MIYFENADKIQNLENLLQFGYRESSLFQKTYSDKECTELQCKKARRSFPDLLEISQTYFPDTTKKDLAKILVEKYNSFICSDHNLLVFLHEYNLGYPDCKPFDDRMARYLNEDFIDHQGYSYNKILKLAT